MEMWADRTGGSVPRLARAMSVVTMLRPRNAGQMRPNKPSQGERGKGSGDHVFALHNARLECTMPMCQVKP